MQMSCWAPMPPIGPWARRWGGGDLVSAMTGQCCAVGVHEVLQDPRAESGRGDGRSGREHRGEPEFAGQTGRCSRSRPGLQRVALFSSRFETQLHGKQTVLKSLREQASRLSVRCGLLSRPGLASGLARASGLSR